jgi:hypothetical protein
MNNRIAGEIKGIREGWSDEEKENRRRVASTMQLQLGQLVAFAERVDCRQQPEARQVSIASVWAGKSQSQSFAHIASLR